MRQDQDLKLHDEPPVFFINTIDQKIDDQEALSGEIQHLFRSKYINITSGVGYFDIDSEETLISSVIFPPFTISEKFDRDVNHTNLYLYSNFNLPANVTLTVGWKWRFLQH